MEMRVKYGPCASQGEYKQGIIIKFLLIFLLFVVYALTPYTFSPTVLIWVTLLLVAYAGYIFLQQQIPRGVLLLIAAGMNFYMSFMRSKGVNTLLAIIIILILLYDIVCTQQQLDPTRKKERRRKSILRGN